MVDSVVEGVVVSIVEDMIPDVAEAAIAISTNIPGMVGTTTTIVFEKVCHHDSDSNDEKSAVFVLCAHHSAPKRSPAAVLGPDA